MAAAERRKGVVTAGTWCADHNKLVDRWPTEDHIAEIVSEAWQGGGPGCNLAVGMKKLDSSIHVETIGLVGDDEDGRRLIAEADAHAIRRDQLQVTRDAATNYTDAFTSRASGRRTHIFFPGASALLSPDHFDFAATRARFLHLGLPGLHRTLDAPWGDDPNGWVTVLKRARAAGLLANMELASIGTDRIAAVVRPCLPHLDYLIVNDVEIGALAGADTVRDGMTDIESCVRALRAVMHDGSMRLAVVHFPAGAIALERDGPAAFAASVRVPADQIIGSNGAGDAFAAGVLYGVMHEWSVTQCLRLGHASAAASLRSITTTGTIEAWRRCLDLADAWGWREAAADSATLPP